MKPLWIIRIVAIGLILLFGLGTLGAGYAIFVSGISPLLLFALAINLGFVIASIGLLKLKTWGWWLTIVLCAVSILQLLWQLFTKLTPQTATSVNEGVSFMVAGFYLAIGMLLSKDSVRKTFKEQKAVRP